MELLIISAAQRNAIGNFLVQLPFKDVAYLVGILESLPAQPAPAVRKPRRTAEASPSDAASPVPAPGL